MKRLNIISLMLFFLFEVCILFCQDAQQNHEKYWYYRHRLINNFMLVGDCQGCSLPAMRRYHLVKTGSQGNIDDIILDWWDGQDPGWYIGILATEYALLKKNNQDTYETRRELFYALEAINRMDQTAEQKII